MSLQIISNEMLMDYQKKCGILLIDLRDYESYCKGHLPGALWMSHALVLKEIPLLLEHYYATHGQEADLIALYCHSGRISLATAKSLAKMGYSVLSLYGGYSQWNIDSSINSPLEFHEPL